MLSNPAAVEVVAQAAVCEPERDKEVPVIVEEALGGGGVIVATLEPLGATANEITAVNRMYMHVYKCTVGLFYIHVHVGSRRLGVLTCTVYTCTLY